MGRKKKENKLKSMSEFKQEFLPPVELKTDPDYPVKFPEMVVAGHKVTPREADIFYTYHTTHDPNLICKRFGMTRQNLWDLTKRPWWISWNISQLKEWLDTARNQWLSSAHKLIKAQSDFLDNPDDYPPGYGQTIAKMIDTLLRVSPEGIRPTLVSKFEMEHAVNINESIDININITPEKIKSLSPEQIDEWNRTGVMPHELSESIEEALDIEYEEIEDEEEEDDST